MNVTIADVEHIARLARLNLAEGEKESYTNQLNQILDYMEKLNELDTTNIVPLTHPMEKQNVLREDVTRLSLDRDAALKNAPKANDEYFLVPRVIKGNSK